jgi:hypothetical protein
MSHPYEYTMMVQYITPSTTSQVPDYGEEDAQHSLTGEFSRMAKMLPEAFDAMPADADWEINSHSLSFTGNTVVVSFLLRRPRR